MSTNDEQAGMLNLAQAVERARALGAIESEWLCETQQTVSFRWSEQEVHEVVRATRQPLWVRVWTENGHSGQSEGTVKGLEQALTAALKRARQGKPSPHDLPVRFVSQHRRPLSIEGRRHSGLSVEDRSDVVAGAYQAMKKLSPEFEAEGMTWSDVRIERTFVNSRGVSISEAETSYRAEVEVSHQVEEGRITASMAPSSRRFSVLASMPYAVKAGQQLLHVLGDTIPLSGPVRVMFGSAATARLIDAITQGFLDGAVPRFLMHGEEPRVLDRRLNLLDDGSAVGGLRSRSFDDRGVVPKPVMLIRDGQVRGRLVSLREARMKEIEPTGHEVKGRLRPSNLTLMSGTRSLNAIAIARGGPSLWIEDLPALTPGTLDLKSGWLSCRVNGRVLEGNQVKGVVRGVQLTGDLGVALEQVVEIASDTDREGHIDAPGLVVDGLQVGSGA